MSLPLSLYEFNKRKNSTKQPTGTAIAVPYVDLKESTSLNSPTFLLSGSVPFNANYCKYEGTYYWIDDITIDANNLWNIQCSIDPLATYANEIKSTRAFLEFASGGDTRIPDPRLSKKMNATEITERVKLSSAVIDDVGCLILQVVGYGCSGTVAPLGGTAAIDAVRDILDEAANWYDQATNFDISSVEKAIRSFGRLGFSGSAADCLKGCYWVPMVPTMTGPHNLFLGLYDTQFPVYFVNNAETYATQQTITVPHPPNQYQRNSQCSDYNLYIPYVGNIALSADILADETEIYIDFSVAPVTGEFTCCVKTGSLKVLGTYGSSVRVEIPLGSSGMNFKNLVNTLSGGISGLHKGASIGNIIGEGEQGAGVITSGIGSIMGVGGALLSTEGSNSSIGGIGCAASMKLSQYIELTCSYWDMSDSYNNMSTIIGNPYFKTDTIGNHTYVKTGGASVSGVARGTVLSMINSYLSGGVYIE